MTPRGFILVFNFLLFSVVFCLCVRYVRIVGTHNTVNKVFHLVAFECMFTNRSFTLENGLVGKLKNKKCVADVSEQMMLYNILH